MRVLLLRDSRIRHKAGEIVEVSPAEAGFLLSTNSAVPIAAQEQPKQEPKKTVKKTAVKK